MGVRSPVETIRLLRFVQYRPCFREAGHDVVARRWQTTDSLVSKEITEQRSHAAHESVQPTVLSRLPTSSLLRSIVLGSILTTPSLFTPGFALLKMLARSKFAFFNPDKNILLKSTLRPLVYDHFCAGTNAPEIHQRVSSIRSMGFSGVILAYGREVLIHDEQAFTSEVQTHTPEHDAQLDSWLKGNLETLQMIGHGQDFIAIKLSGAGTQTCTALMKKHSPSKQLNDALAAICQKAREMKCKLIVDAEQQVLQESIDRIAIFLMRTYNRDGNTLVYNTLQAYLKQSRRSLIDQLTLAEQEGWTLGIKLVRGAYINSDPRELIHDTKANTDDCYNSIVADLLKGNLPGFDKHKFPHMKLFAAGHNKESIDKAIRLIKSLSATGELKILPEFGQLQGMADELGCSLLHYNDSVAEDKTCPPVKVYKYLVWGSVQECMEYLVRRAVENRGAADRLRVDMAGMIVELRSRLWARMMGGRRGS